MQINIEHLSGEIKNKWAYFHISIKIEECVGDIL